MKITSFAAVTLLALSSALTLKYVVASPAPSQPTKKQTVKKAARKMRKTVKQQSNSAQPSHTNSKPKALNTSVIDPSDNDSNDITSDNHKLHQVEKFDSSILTLNLFGKSDQSSQSEFNALATQAPSLNKTALRFALNGFDYAKQYGSVNKNILTVVDFTQPSRNKRMYVFNLDNNTLIMQLRVTHGKNSGLDYATHFSNSFDSKESSLGVYTTADTFYGEHGRALHLAGIEKGLNNNATDRDIEIHKAWYASNSFVKSHGRTGLSWGCFAVSPAKVTQFINTTKDGSVIFAYAPQEKNDPHVNGTDTA